MVHLGIHIVERGVKVPPVSDGAKDNVQSGMGNVDLSASPAGKKIEGARVGRGGGANWLCSRQEISVVYTHQQNYITQGTTNSSYGFSYWPNQQGRTVLLACILCVDKTPPTVEVST